MPGLARSEASSCANPVLTFLHQVGGFLVDLNELRFSVVDLSTAPPTVVVADTAVVLTACPAGQRLSVGRYVAPFTAGAAWVIGTHEIIWQYRSVAGGPLLTVRRRFEVLDPALWPSGRYYLGYVDSSRALNLGLTLAVGQTNSDLQLAIELASRQVELYTGRFFEPRYEVYRLSSKGGRDVVLGPPIIGVESVTVESAGIGGVVVGSLLDTNLYRVYNRHLRGMNDPDDRDAPKIEFNRTADPAVFPDIGSLTFALGTQNVVVVGAFGYTDADSTPFGQTPLLIGRVTVNLARRHLEDPTFSEMGSGRIKSARTRDQSVAFLTPRDTGVSGGGTGDVYVDSILLQFHRPPHFGLVGSAAR